MIFKNFQLEIRGQMDTYVCAQDRDFLISLHVHMKGKGSDFHHFGAHILIE